MKLRNKKILLTGGKGTLGSNLIPLLKGSGARVDAPTKKEVDVGDIIAICDAMDVEEYDLVIHCAAFTNVPKCELLKHQKEAVETNIFGSSNVAYATGERDSIKAVYISTDYVYPCVKGNYTEEDETSPRTFYGFTKLAGESFFDLDKDLVIRTSFAKRGTWGPGRNQYSVAFTDSYTTKDWVDVIAPLVIEAITQEKTGVLNIGTTKKSIHDLAVVDYPEVTPVSIKDIDLSYEYPLDSSLESSI